MENKNEFHVASWWTVENYPTHWSDGLKMLIEKNGVSIKLESNEIEELVKSLPKTFGGSYK